jgi:hypothetical protein
LISTQTVIFRVKASSREIVVTDFFELGLKEEAESLRRETTPKSGPTRDIVFEIIETEIIMEKLGFREVGTLQ